MPTTSSFTVRPAQAADLAAVVTFPQNADELFYCYPKASWPLSVGQLAAAMAERRDSTVVCLDDRVAGFSPIMPTYEGQISEEELAPLVEYIRSLGEGQGNNE